VALVSGHVVRAIRSRWLALDILVGGDSHYGRPPRGSRCWPMRPLIDVVTLPTVISSDASRALGFVADYQPLNAWTMPSSGVAALPDLWRMPRARRISRPHIARTATSWEPALWPLPEKAGPPDS
jgi:hypothetical protein